MRFLFAISEAAASITASITLSAMIPLPKAENNESNRLIFVCPLTNMGYGTVNKK